MVRAHDDVRGMDAQEPSFQPLESVKHSAAAQIKQTYILPRSLGPSSLCALSSEASDDACSRGARRRSGPCCRVRCSVLKQCACRNAAGLSVLGGMTPLVLCRLPSRSLARCKGIQFCVVWFPGRNRTMLALSQITSAGV